MKKYQLSLDDTFEDPFHIFAIYSEEESYRLAFILNQVLHLHLKKTKPIIRKNDQASFEIYEYDDISLYQHWYLIHNHALIQDKSQSNDLFTTSLFERKVHYIPELKKAPYLLKITAEVDAQYLRSLLEKLQYIHRIYAVELIPLGSINKQKLLIF